MCWSRPSSSPAAVPTATAAARYLQLVPGPLTRPVARTAGRVLFVVHGQLRPLAPGRRAVARQQRPGRLGRSTQPAGRPTPGAIAALPARSPPADAPASRPCHISDVWQDGDLIITVCDLAREELGRQAAATGLSRTWSRPGSRQLRRGARRASPAGRVLHRARHRPADPGPFVPGLPPTAGQASAGQQDRAAADERRRASSCAGRCVADPDDLNLLACARPGWRCSVEDAGLDVQDPAAWGGDQGAQDGLAGGALAAGTRVDVDRMLHDRRRRSGRSGGRGGYPAGDLGRDRDEPEPGSRGERRNSRRVVSKVALPPRSRPGRSLVGKAACAGIGSTRARPRLGYGYGRAAY